MLSLVSWRSLLGDAEKFHEDYEPTLGEHALPNLYNDSSPIDTLLITPGAEGCLMYVFLY